jgi:hypothetical protein
MNLQWLEDLCAELVQPGCERSAILAALSDSELQNAFIDVSRQLGLELLCGLDSHSHWTCDFLMIVANQGPIHACQTAFYAILVELERRGVDEPNVA